jgi:hypothetical protein
MDDEGENQHYKKGRFLSVLHGIKKQALEKYEHERKSIDSCNGSKLNEGDV